MDNLAASFNLFVLVVLGILLFSLLRFSKSDNKEECCGGSGEGCCENGGKSHKCSCQKEK